MKPKKIFLGIFTLFLTLAVTTGCERNDHDDFRDAVFNILDESGAPVSSRQVFYFNTSSKLPIEVQNVASTHVAVPSGWSCEVSIPGRTISISAPDAGHSGAELQGEVVITSKGVNGSTVVTRLSVEAVDAEVQLSCANHDISKPVILAYGESTSLSLSASNVERIEMTDAPSGWTIVRSNMEIAITAPAADNNDAIEIGQIEIKPYSKRGNKGASLFVNLEVAELPIEFTCKEDISAVIPFRLSNHKTFAFTTSSNVTDVEITGAPKGWIVTPDLKKMEFTIAAPSAVTSDLETEGKLTLTPVSNRGTKGTPVEIDVALNVTAPVLEFDVTSKRFGFGQTLTLRATKAINVNEVQLKSAPAGWDIVPNMGALTCIITAPSSLGSCNPSGKVVFTATSTTSETLDVEVEVKLNGIYSAEEFMLFANAVNESTSLNDYLLGNTVNLFADITLSETGRPIIVGKADKLFGGVFDGHNKCVTVSLVATEDGAGLFHTLAAGAEVKNLRLAGTITTSVAPSYVGGVALINDGASLSNVSSSVSFTCSSTANSGYYGGMVGYNRKSGSSYVECHSTGAVTTRGIKYFGGLIGAIETDTEGTMTDCSNSGNITLNYGANDRSNSHVGGCVGSTSKSKWTFTRISNTGNINYNFGKSNKPIYALGGVFGSANGRFDGCFNTGHVIDTDGAASVAGTRRIGGFAGVSSESGYTINATNCRNEGNVTGISNYIAGFIGILEKGTVAMPHILTDCSNSGNVYVVSNTSISGMFGGFVGVSYAATNMTRCRNSGKVIGYTNRSAGGLVGCGADDLVLDQCENSGMVYIGATAASNPRVGRPFVGGLVAIRGTNVVKISNSRNTGNVTAMVQSPNDVASVYTSEIVTVDGKVDVTVCDDATKNASTGATITYILKDNWNTNLPDM